MALRGHKQVGLVWLVIQICACSLDTTPVITSAPELSAATVDDTIDAAAEGGASVVASSQVPRPSAPALSDAGLPAPLLDAGEVSQDDAGPTAPGPVAAPSIDCDDSAQRYVSFAKAHCASCHGPGSPGAGGFASVLDVPALIASGKVVPSAPERSPLFVRLSTGVMPPLSVVKRPTREDVDAVRGWIGCGAPNTQPLACQADCTTFVDIPTRLTTMVNDLKVLDAETRADVRYLDLTHYANAGHGEQQLNQYRDALAYTMNSLSRAATLVLPQAVDAQSLVYRIRLKDYAWTADTWQQLIAAYPYAVDYDPNSRNFPIDDGLLIRLREQTGTSIPYVQADWFFSHAVRPPLYYALLGVPGNLRQLEAQLDVSIADNIENKSVARAGFQVSGPSHYNRVIERHALGVNAGALWLTYDFDAGSGFSNIITHPLDFRSTSSEILFALPNGLHGYMSVDAKGARLDKAPTASVQDNRANDRVIESGISCINCHAQTGVIVKHDELHEQATLAATSVEASNAIVALYKDAATLDALFAEDRARYQSALTMLGLRSFTEGTARALDDAYAAFLTAKQIAGVLGIREQQLLAAIEASPGVFSQEALALRMPGSMVPRDRFDAQFAQLVRSLGLGTPQAP